MAINISNGSLRKALLVVYRLLSYVGAIFCKLKHIW